MDVVECVLEERKYGYSLSQVASFCGVSIYTVRKVLLMHGDPLDRVKVRHGDVEKPKRFYLNIVEKDGTKTEIWCGEVTLGKYIEYIKELKAKGRLKQAKIYRYHGRKRVLEQVIK